MEEEKVKRRQLLKEEGRANFIQTVVIITVAVLLFMAVIAITAPNNLELLAAPPFVGLLLVTIYKFYYYING
jgi:hypothetical protein